MPMAMMARRTSRRRVVAAAVFTDPLDLPNTWWLSASSGLTLNGSDVTQWDARGDVAASFVQATAGRRPQQGLDHVSFYSDEHLSLYEATPTIAVDDFLLFGLFRAWNVQADVPLLSKWQTVSDQRVWQLRTASAGTLEWLFSADGAATSTVTIGSLQGGNLHAFVVRKVGTVVTAWIDRVSASVSGSAPASLSSANPPIDLAAINSSAATAGTASRIAQWFQVGLSLSVDDASVDDLNDWLATVQADRRGWSWNGRSLNGPYTTPTEVLPETIVFEPNGASVTEGDIASWRYSHHTDILARSGALYLASTRAADGELDSGQITVAYISANLGVNWAGPYVLMGPEDDFNEAPTAEGPRVCQLDCWAVYSGTLYAILGLEDMPDGDTSPLGIGLFARSVASDGTLGAIFRVTEPTYTPRPGKALIAHDAILGPPLLAYATIWGKWAGTHPSVGTPEAWSTRIKTAIPLGGGIVLGEPTVVAMDGTDTELLRYWRQGGNVAGEDTSRRRVFAHRSSDGGDTWGTVVSTDIPDAPSSTRALRLADGRVVVVGNPNNGSIVRERLYAAVGTVGRADFDAVYDAATALTDDPTYFGAAKEGGPAYPGAAQIGSTLFVSYSLQKERLAVRGIAIS